MSKTRGIATKARDLRKSDTVLFMGLRHNVVAAISRVEGVTLQLQVPGKPVQTFHQVDPGFTFTRIAQ